MNLTERIENSFLSVEKGEIFRSIIEDTERLILEKALSKTRGNQILAARILGINRNTIRTKIKKLNISLEQFK